MSDSFATPWTVAHQAPLSMGFPRRECWRGLPFPFLGDLPDPTTEPTFPALVSGFFTTEPSAKPHVKFTLVYFWCYCKWYNLKFLFCNCSLLVCQNRFLCIYIVPYDLVSSLINSRTYFIDSLIFSIIHNYVI